MSRRAQSVRREVRARPHRRPAASADARSVAFGDITTIKPTWEADGTGRFVGALTGLGQRRAQCGHVEHPPAVADDPGLAARSWPGPQRGSGMKDLDVAQAIDGLQILDRQVTLVMAGIA